MKNTSSFLILPSLIMALSSCHDRADDPKKNEENELITKVKLHLTKEGAGNQMVHAEWKDETPDDNNNRVIDTLRLDTSSVYFGEIELEDETKKENAGWTLSKRRHR